MTAFRALHLLLALVLLCTAPLLQAGEKSGRNITDPDWNKTHPRVNAYYKAFNEKRWKDAAAIISTWDISNEYYSIYEEYATVFDALGEKKTALGHMDTRLRFCFTRKEEIKPLEEVRRLAKFAQDRGLRSSVPIAAALQYHLSGESDIAFAMLQNLDAKEVYAELAPGLQKEIAHKAFQSAYKREDAAAAAAITAYLIDHGIPLLEHAQAMAQVCEKAGDKTLTLQLMEYRIDHAGLTTDQKLALAKEAQDYAGWNDLKPRHWLVRLCYDRARGHKLRQLAELDVELRARKGNPEDRPVKLQYLRETLVETIETTFKNSAYDTTISCCAYLDWLHFPPDESLLNSIITAHDLGGKTDVAIQLCGKYAWHFSAQEERVCDPQGNPELIKQGAYLAAKTNKPTGIPLIDAWAAYLKDQSSESLNVLYRMALANESKPVTFDANTPYPAPNFEEASACAVASFLCGDAHAERKEPWRALFWYQRATYLVSDVMAGSPQNSQEDSHFHEVLGVARQAKVLSLLGKPDTAEAELRGLLEADPQLRTEVLKRNTLLRKEWSSAEWEIQFARKNPQKLGNPRAEELQKQDLIEVPGAGMEKRSTAATMIPRLRASKNYTVARAEERERARTRVQGGARNFVESYLEQERQERLNAARRDIQADEGSYGGQEVRPQRRCASCLGSGKAGYVTGSRFYSRDSHNMPTNNQVSADCSYCNGTGWR